eukprot:1003676-Pelagomonas_calceolata.AAC.1
MLLSGSLARFCTRPLSPVAKLLLAGLAVQCWLGCSTQRLPGSVPACTSLAEHQGRTGSKELSQTSTKSKTYEQKYAVAY